MSLAGGINAIVKIYESKFSKKKYNRGHVVEDVRVFWMVERSAERKIGFVAMYDERL